MQFLVDDETFTLTPLRNDEPQSPHSWFDDEQFGLLSRWWTQASWQRRHSYQFRWLGVPIIQLPADTMMLQEVVWDSRPDVIIETGVAHGGSIVLHASILHAAHAGDASGRDSRPHVFGIDIDIREPNRRRLESHPLRQWFTLIEGSSTDPSIVARVRQAVSPMDRVMVVLDSNHSADHVTAELAAYAPLVSPGCALVVLDGVMRILADLPDGQASWKEDNPTAAVDRFLQSPTGADFEIDHRFDGFAVTHAPGGVLRRREGAPA